MSTIAAILGHLPRSSCHPGDPGDGSGYRLRAGDELSGEDVVPGFRCPVVSLFPATRPEGSGETTQGPSAS